ncbi:hypothetical protein FRC12_015102, partial [Ceratobasidium sp. 428]
FGLDEASKFSPLGGVLRFEGGDRRVLFVDATDNLLDFCDGGPIGRRGCLLARHIRGLRRLGAEEGREDIVSSGIQGGVRCLPTNCTYTKKISRL